MIFGPVFSSPKDRNGDFIDCLGTIIVNQRQPAGQEAEPKEIVEKRLRASIAMYVAPADVYYRGYRIVFDVQPPLPERPFWTGKAAVLFQGNGSGKNNVHHIPESVYFITEEETRGHLVGAAKDWIDKEIEIREARQEQLPSIILWDESFSVGIKEIDEQHKELIRMINSLVENEDARANSEAIADVLERLTKYADYHFEIEEQLMVEYKYPGLDSQKSDHTESKANIVKFCLDALRQKETLAGQLVMFLQHWITSHILESDMKYKAFFSERGIT